MEYLSIEAINELRRNARSVVRELGLLNDAYFEIGVTLAERHLLIELAGSNSPTVGEIAERLLLDKSTVSRLISKAAKKGYIKCTTDKKDKRKRFIKITNKGQETLHAFEPIAFNQTQEALLTLTEDEIKTVHNGVALYAKGLKHSRIRNKISEESTSHQNQNISSDDSSNKIENLSEILDKLNHMGYQLRLFDPKDEDELHEIFREVVDSGLQFPYECSSLEEFRRQFFPLENQGCVYVCHNQERQIIGGFYLRSNFSGKSSHIANAAYMIRDFYRGKGIGSLLIKASLNFAKNFGFRAMQFNMVLSQNVIAVKLYKKLGFNIVGTLIQAVRNIDGSYQDGYIMYRKLETL